MKKIFLLLFLSFLGCKSYYQVSDSKSQYYLTDVSLEPDSEIEEIIDPYRDQLNSKMNTIIGISETELTKAKPESTLGNFVADAILFAAKKRYEGTVDFSLPNYGGMRVPYIKAGEISLGNIFELMPFDNKLVIVHLDGALVKELLDHACNLGGWPISKGVEIKLDTLNKQHEYKINGKSLDLKSKYAFCVSDYIANGGDNCSFLKTKEREDLDLLFRDALIEYVREKKIISVNLEERTTYK